MTPFIYPPNPIFKNLGERKVFETIVPLLSDDDAIFANLELSDPREGDIEIDLVLLLKDYGLMAIEVKGSHITFDYGRWIQSDPAGTHPIDPAAQAKRNMYALRDYISRNWSQGNLRSDWIVAFPHSNVVDVRDPNLPMAKIIQKDGLDRSLSQIKNLLANIKTFPLPAYDGWVEVAVKTLIPLAAQETDRAGVLGNNYEFIRGLTHEKESLLAQLSDNDRYYVKGPAGSGKTWLAYEQARRWSLEGLKVGIVVYNRGLASYMANKHSDVSQDQKAAWMGTFHDFASMIGSTAGDPAHYGDEIDRYGDDLRTKASALTDDEKFDAWVVDEAQDFLPSWWQALELSLRDQVHGKMALFGDDQQHVFGHRPAPVGNFASFRLNENLRNSQQIAHAVSKFVPNPTVARGPHAFEIEYVEASASEVFERADDVVEQLTDKEFWHPGEIALLTTKSRHPEYVRQADKDRQAHWESLWTNEDVFYCTAGGFKGLERPVVVLAVDGFHSDKDSDDVLYVGMSRARDKLVVVADAAIIARLRKMNAR
ncbi:unannotated protein [freshwater metagenome]|uniref:Unannotated protein n=1 Tax=freshwater metagenome TaxID=449393 RepID=A0A6J7XUU2_9ZZZZ